MRFRLSLSALCLVSPYSTTELLPQYLLFLFYTELPANLTGWIWAKQLCSLSAVRAAPELCPAPGLALRKERYLASGYLRRVWEGLSLTLNLNFRILQDYPLTGKLHSIFFPSTSLPTLEGKTLGFCLFVLFLRSISQKIWRCWVQEFPFKSLSSILLTLSDENGLRGVVAHVIRFSFSPENF